jgi:4-amino-4-deoxy-L-arabinose transferase-like glycosyltransferase
LSDPLERSRARETWGLFGLAFAVRAVAYARTDVIFNDGPRFIGMARQMAAGEWSEALAHDYHPFYALLSSWAHVLVPDWELAGGLVSIVGGSLAVVALHALLRVAFDARVARIGALLLALHPYAIRFSADVQSDSVHLALFLFATALLYQALRDASPALAFASGALSGLAYLTRPEGASVVVVGLAMTTAAWLRGGWRAGPALRFGAALVAGLGLLALPYLLVLRSLAGGWRFSQKKSVLELIGMDAMVTGDDPGLPLWITVAGLVLLSGALGVAGRRIALARSNEGASVRIGAAALAGVVLLSAAVVVIGAPAQAAEFAAVWVSTMRPEQLVLVALGIGTLARAGPKGRALFIASFQSLYAVLLFGLLLHYGYLSRRHALPPITLLMGYGALGVVWCASELGSRLGREPTDAQAPSSRWIAVVVLLLAAIALPKAWTDHRSEQLAGRRAAEWLREYEGAPGRLASRASKLGYYAEREWRPLRDRGERRPAEALRAEGVRWLIVEGRTPYELEPEGPGAERHRESAKGWDAVVVELEATSSR